MNRLSHAQSLYLRKHAENPINWWTWCDEAPADSPGVMLLRELLRNKRVKMFYSAIAPVSYPIS